MSQAPLPEVFSVTEIARAAAVPVDAVRALLERGELMFVTDTPFVAVPDPARVGARLRQVALTLQPREPHELFEGENAGGPRRSRKPAVVSFAAHAALVTLAVWLSTGRIETAAVDDTVREDAHLVFLLTPGPGGGGGGGGDPAPRPAPKIERLGKAHADIPVPVVEQPRDPDPAPKPAPEPQPPQPVMAPVAAVATNDREREGQIERAVEAPDSRGPGDNGGIGSSQGTGNGEGRGAGIGDGEGGGTGGGPYRPGSGMEPPRLLHEVKAEYTDDARRQGITGDVLLEIVVRHDGGVGDVRVLQGLGAGLDERAITAVKQWQFNPARRKSAPVDVLVEVAVEFTLR